MSKLGVHKVTQSEKTEFLAFIDGNPSLSSVLPATLPCGFTIDEFHAVCSKCGENIPSNWSWVCLTRHEFGRNVVETWDVRGLCKPCRTLTPCYMRFRSDGTYDTLIGHQWRHGRLRDHGNRLGSLAKIIARRVLRRFFGRR